MNNVEFYKIFYDNNFSFTEGMILMRSNSMERNVPLILIVDDSMLIRLKLKEVLEGDGYLVAEASDGIQALDLYKRVQPDMVLLDGIMPEMDGFTVCSLLQKHYSGDKTPVLMVTTLDDDKSVDLAFEAGATDYITKPIQWAVLRHRVRRLLRARKAEDIVNKRLVYEKMVSEISFRTLAIDEPDIFKNECLEIMARKMDVSRIYIFEYDPLAKLVFNTHEWVAPGVMPRKGFLQDIHLDTDSWWVKKFNNDQLINCHNIDDIPMEKDKENLRSQGVKSMLMVPLDIGEGYMACIGFDECRYYRFWPEEDISMLRIAAQIIGGAVRRKHMEKSLRQAHHQMKQLLASISSIFIGVDHDGRIIKWNNAAEKTFGIPAASAEGKYFKEIGISWHWKDMAGCLADPGASDMQKRVEDIRYTRPDGKEGLLDITINTVSADGDKPPGFVIMGADITEKKKIEAQLVFLQKMDSIGRLAAGIAHEINTPMQYIGDNMVFLMNAFTDMCKFYRHFSDLVSLLESKTITDSFISMVRKEKDQLDMDFLISEIPIAIEQSMKGIERVSKLVLAMKDFSHPGTKEKAFSNINSAIEGTITISRNEWKYVAELKTDLDPNLPTVFCVISEINQVVLNMIVNAAQAIKDLTPRCSTEKGKIIITTRKEGDFVHILVSDTGGGIPQPIMDKIFDPFFTTKEVGIGTGQGLAIAHNIIVNKHGGKINVESELGVGTTFIITLPVKYDETNGESGYEEKNTVCG